MSNTVKEVIEGWWAQTLTGFENVVPLGEVLESWAEIWRGMVDLWTGDREGLWTHRPSAYLTTIEEEGTAKESDKLAATGPRLLFEPVLYCYLKKILQYLACVSSRHQFKGWQCVVWFRSSSLHLPLSSLPSHASGCQLLKGLVYGRELVFNRQNQEIFGVWEADLLLPLDSKHIDLLLRVTSV